ncbi:MAG: molybdopterin biosynthesis protein, partial [Desulfamplus sp.]|nr:molybdopterin biosynthesis protein [Desulfamplus sp.]
MTIKRNVYLSMKSIEEAKKILFEHFPISSNADSQNNINLKTIANSENSTTEEIDAVNALGRILAEPAVAALSSPNFHAAAMDGIAVDAKSTFGASDESPKLLITGKDYFWINTGHVMPDGTNAVIMVEHLNVIGEQITMDCSNQIEKDVQTNHQDQEIEIYAPAVPWQNVRKMGEDIVATELLFPRGHRINAYSIGALISGGVFRVTVRRKPKVLIIPTGSEIKSWQKAQNSGLSKGDVIDSNSEILGALCVEYGASFYRHEIIKDDLEKITDAVKDATQSQFSSDLTLPIELQSSNQGKHINRYDMVFIIGGSSAGSKDFSKPVISALGEVYVHGVTMMPGKPLLFGKVNDTPVFGIPGYPVSAIVAFEQFAGPLLLKMQGIDPDYKQRKIVEVEPSRKIASKLGQEEFLRVKIGAVDDRLIASQLPRGAGNITTLTQADGIIRIPANVEGIAEGEPVKAELIRSRSAINQTLVIIGSHDNTLDILSDHIHLTARNSGRSSDINISSTHVGSMGGLMAIKKRACHIAGTHLLDADDGSYNISYIKKYLPNEKVWLVNLVMRDQGLIIPKGNPKNIKGIEDFRSDIVKNGLSESSKTQNQGLVFINRQAGAGTRILFDYKLKSLGIKPFEIIGYDNEEYTHMSVAVAVLSGRADGGLGIYAAAKALDLDFIPVVTEEYDLLIPDRFFNSDKVQILLDTIRTENFKRRVEALGGYGTQKTGEII